MNANRHERANHKWWTLAAMCFALFMIMLDNTVVNVALPSIQRSLKTTPENLEWTINAYFLSFAALILLGGKLGDRFGRKKIFLVGLAIFTLSSAACALSTSDAGLISARAVQGVGAAFMNPLSLSIIVAAFPRHQVPTAIGIWAGISGLGLAIGPLLGGFLVEHANWSAVFWINVPIGVLAAGATLWFVQESRDPNARGFDIVGTVLVTGGLFSLVWALIRTNSHSWSSPQTVGFLVAAAVLLVGFIFWEDRQPEPMLPLSFFRRRAFDVAVASVALIGFAMFGIIYFLTLYLQNVRGYSAIESGVRTLPMTVMVILVAPIAGKLSARIGPRPLMAGGMLIMSLGLASLTRLSIDASYWTVIFPSFVCVGAGIAMSMPTTTGVAMGSVDPTRAGIASGVINSSRQVGGALGVAVLGSIAATVASSRWADNAPAALHGQRFNSLVVGGQVAPIGKFAGANARLAASNAFIDGVTTAMTVGAALALTGAVVAWFGLRGFSPVAAPQGAPVAVEA
ncbi:MAG TPA: MFS transporter [Gaiellales bacterium]|jgi:EmrB/QacA subfamily drug resistance transporter|nr:MFS transporter [Gaiellales bacterium]